MQIISKQYEIHSFPFSKFSSFSLAVCQIMLIFAQPTLEYANVMKRSLLKIAAPILFVTIFFMSVGYKSVPVDDGQQAQDVIAEMNRCRQNPKEYAETTLKKHLACFVNESTFRDADGNMVVTTEGRRRVLEAINELKGMQPVGPLTYDEDLANAARFHCADTGPSGHTGHDSSDGTTMTDRLMRFVKDRMRWGENIHYGSCSAEDIVVSLVVDDGVPSRGHLQNIMDSSYRRAGAAIGPHRTYRFMCVIDYSD